jgi:hypothetical protein
MGLVAGRLPIGLQVAINYFSPTTGDAGVASVTINGRNFTGANSVTLHNTAASFTVVSDTQIAATVPCTATAGPIEVATPGGSAIGRPPCRCC